MKKMAIIGAILGDIAGQPFEFNHTKEIDFENIELFSTNNHFTDDTVLTIATKYALEQHIPFEIAYHTLANAYPNAGYGGSFVNWLADKSLRPYNSFGNGSAMRVSPVIDYAKNEKELLNLSTISASCTHNHPEGIKGAVTTAYCGWMAKYGASKREIEDYACKAYPKEDYAFSCEHSLKYIREKYFWNDTCQGTVPVAIRCFLSSEDYESFLRNAISINGDTDTIAAIGGCIAEEFYGGTGFNNG
jgi:ADP-ribosylglycohydrolase